jgi:hypothetical protein
MALTPAGTQRRLRALFACGWSDVSIERVTGIPSRDISTALARRSAIRPEFSRSVASAYERLWNKQPPRATQEEREEADAAAEYGRRWGWAPPMALDDDEIDNPGYKPAGWKRTTDRRRSAALVEDMDWIRQAGGYQDATTAVMAVRLGVSKDALEKALRRQGRTIHADRDLEAS